MRIVFADDSSLCRQKYSSYIELAGHDVVAIAKDGAEAARLCQEHRPDVALLDANMGGAPGTVSAQAIIAAKTATHVVLWTSQVNVKRDAERIGIRCWIKSNQAAVLEKLLATLEATPEVV